MSEKTPYLKKVKAIIKALLSRTGDALEIPMLALDRFVARLPVSEKARENFSVRKYGILGTITFHLFLFAMILVVKINAERTPKQEGIEIDMKTLEELARMEMEVPAPGKAPDNSRNIAVDQKEDRVESFEDYKNYRVSDRIVEDLAKSSVEQTVKDIIKEHNLNPDDDELPDIATEELKMFRAEKMEEDQVYQGATNIYFSLEGRKVVNLEVPVYKCQGGGLVKLDIRVNRRGIVEFVSVDTAESQTTDNCLIDAAKAAAMKTRFNLDQTAPLLQSGSLTYRFIAQ